MVGDRESRELEDGVVDDDTETSDRYDIEESVERSSWKMNDTDGEY